MRIAVAADHAGVELKRILTETVRKLGHDVRDLGTFGDEPVDYPDFAAKLAREVQAGHVDRGILICGSAVGVSVVANKFPGIRAGVCHDTYSARQAVEHDDVNVLCLGQRVLGVALAVEVVERFLAARFTEEERHRRRLEKLHRIEEENFRSKETA